MRLLKLTPPHPRERAPCAVARPSRLAGCGACFLTFRKGRWSEFHASACVCYALRDGQDVVHLIEHSRTHHNACGTARDGKTVLVVVASAGLEVGL